MTSGIRSGAIGRTLAGPAVDMLISRPASPTLPTTGAGHDARPAASARNLTHVAGRYRLLEPLGTGGTGTVWLAHDRVLGRRVALKHLTATVPSGRTRSLREARAAARVAHANVVRVYDVVVDNADGAWIVMEALAGRSLATEATCRGRLPIRTVYRVADGLVAALDALHAAGVVHRDVKPSNISLCADGRVVLTDLGSAMSLEGPRVRTTLLTGTLGFIAPETVSTGTYSAATDMYGLGATLFYAAQSRLPFEIGCIEELIEHAASPPESPRPEDAKWLEPLITGLLQPRPASRWDAATARGFLRMHDERGAAQADRTLGGYDTQGR